jgi:hypothetical protein
MATDSMVAGLFSTPEQYQQAQSQAALNRGVQLAQLDPLQAARAQLYQGGYLAGGAIGGALGGQDPMLQRQSQRRAFIQQIDMSSPEALVKGIKASAGDPELNAYLLKQYTDLTNIAQKQSIIDKNKAWEASKTDYKERTNLVAQVEEDLAQKKEVDPVTLNKAKLAFGYITRPQTFAQADGNIVTVQPTVDASMFPNIGQVMKGTGGTGGAGGGGAAGGKAGVITTPLSEEKAAQAEEARRGRLSSLESGAAQLQVTLDTIEQTKSLISNKTTGFGSYLSGIPTTQAMTLADNTEQIKASVALTKLMEMKKESKTGASGLGALNIKELETIQSILGKLNPKSANYAKDLAQIEAFFVRARKAMDEEVRLTREGPAQKQSQTPASPANNNWQNPQGKEGQLAILNQELATARQQGNAANIAGLEREIALLNKSKPSTTGTTGSKLTFDQKVQQTMADPKNAGKTRAQVEAALRAAGHN